MIAVLADGDTVPDANITLESEDPTIAVVDSAHNILAVSRGIATIKVKFITAASGDAPETTFPVKAVFHSITVEPADPLFTGTFFALGDTLFVATGRDASGEPVKNPDGTIVSDTVSFDWSSSEPTVAEVDSGLVTAVGNDSAMITATAVWDSVSGSDSVVVSQIVVSVEVTPDSNRPDTLTALGDTTRFMAVAKDAKDNLVSNLSYNWSSSAEDVATVDSTGDSTTLVTAVDNGEAAITAATARCPFSACDAAPSAAKPDSLPGTVGRAGPQMAEPSKGASSLRQLRAEGLKDGSTLRDPSMASTTGLSDSPARTAATGDAHDPVSGTYTVWVEQKASQVDLAGPGSVEAGVISTAFTLKAQDANGFTATVSESTDFDLSSNSTGTPTFYAEAAGDTVITQATIASGDSMATFYHQDTKSGTATVTATRTLGDALGSAPHQLTVSAGPATQVALTGPDSAEAGVVSGALTLAAQDAYGNTATVSAATVFDLSSNSTGTPTFYIDAAGATAIATVTSAAGDSTATFYYTDTRADAATITATRVSGDALVGATHGITVTAGPATTVVITPEGKSLSGTGSMTMFSAEARDAFGNEISDITWSSLNPNVATVDSATGVATAVASGQVPIAVKANGVSGVVGYSLLTVAVPGMAVPIGWSQDPSGLLPPAPWLEAVWGSSPDNVFAVGDDQTILHYDGQQWSKQRGSTSGRLEAVWGSSPDTVYAVGSALLRYDGSGWLILPTPWSTAPNAIWGSSPNDIYTVGDQEIVHFDGTEWTQRAMPGYSLLGIWGTAANDVYAVGLGGALLHFDGATWQPMASGTTEDLWAVWASAATDVWAVGGAGSVMHFDGSGWQADAVPGAGSRTLYAVWGHSASDVYAVSDNGEIFHYDGSSWSLLYVVDPDLTDGLSGVWGTSAGYVYAVGKAGVILRGISNVASVAVQPMADTLAALGDTVRLQAEARDADGRLIGGVVFAWSSSNTAVATVSSTGLVTAVAAGSATITATAPGGTFGSAAITVLTFASVSAGARSDHSCGVTTDGVAYCWGKGDSGQLGDGLKTNSNVPVAVAGSLSFQSISTGSNHTCGVTAGGAAYCWGNNGVGQLGDSTYVDSKVPVPVSGSLTFRAISAGQQLTCGVTTTETGYCWGDGDGIGDGESFSKNVPVAVNGGLSFQSIVAGREYSCGLTMADAAYCWGKNFDGQLGNDSQTDSWEPVLVFGGLIFQSIAVGSEHTCGLTTADVPYCWGYNGDGQFGDGSNASSTTPVIAGDGRLLKRIAAGDGHTCGVTSTGEAYCGGYNPTGALGDGSIDDSDVFVLVSGDLDLQSISAGFNYTCGLTVSGVVYCWGTNTYGQLGDGSNTYRTEPVRVVDPQQ